MEIKNILTADILDIIFDGKNKAYGAYELRKTYHRRLAYSLLSTFAFCLLFFLGHLLASTKKDITPLDDVPPIILTEVPIKDVPEPVIPPEVKKPMPTKVQTIDYTTIVIVKEADPSDLPPPIDDIVNAKIGLVKNSGTDDVGIVAPPMDGVEKGIVSVPTKPKDNPDSVFMKVEVESEYPGGPSAWMRFLNKKLGNNYPQDAAEKGIQGQVIIQFIVDREGNVSDVQAVAGPKELHEAAVKVIRQSGKWIPAIQNGNQVKSYKKQPITFQLDVE